MADYAILPSTLNIQFVRGDEFGMLLDFDQSCVGYSFVTEVYEIASVSNGVVTRGATFTTFTITNVDLAAGKINLSLTESQTEAFNLAKNYRWYLRWIAPGVVIRTVLSGAISVGDP
jgi:hypothetical protein